MNQESLAFSDGSVKFPNVLTKNLHCSNYDDRERTELSNSRESDRGVSSS
ncbi:MAG: hypothetical protein ACK460_07760 [Microcystis sp.]